MRQRVIKISSKLLRKEFRHRELKILFLATVISVATVSLISLLGDHLQKLIVQTSSQFIAADRQLKSPRTVPSGWIETAKSLNLETAHTLNFASMLFAGDEMQLVSVKAVSDGYPLKGALETSEQPFSPAKTTNEIPSPGTIWLNPRLFSLMSVSKGSIVSIGDKEFKVTQVINREPDVGFGMSAVAPRAMINIADIDATGVVQPGSRLSWTYLFAGSDSALTALDFWLKPKLSGSHKWVGVKEGRPAIASSIEKAETYLLLGGSLAVLLACVAIAMSSRQYSTKQVDAVALLKTLGLSGSQVVSIFALQITFIFLIAGFAGTALGLAGYALGISSLGSLFPELSYSLNWYDFKLTTLFVGWATGAVVMLTFALPPIINLKLVPPMKVLRRETAGVNRFNWLIGVAGGCGTLLLLYLYSQDWILVAILMSSFAVLSALLLLVSFVLLKTVSIIGTGASTYWRLGVSSIVRRRWQTVFQIQVFSLALLLLAVIYLTRTALLGDWQAQLPEDAPNHFLINISQEQVEDIASYFDREGVRTSGLYPMVRGRLSHINSTPVKMAVSKEKDFNALNRELNLTWSDRLPSDNTLKKGEWWYESREQEANRVSVESTLAEKLGLKLGDQLTFTIGDRQVDVDIQSIRTVEWDSMRPNFYMIFPEGVLDRFPSTFITSVYLTSEQKSLLNALSRKYPTITILEIDQLIGKVRHIIYQVSTVIELIMYLILAASFLVVMALINISMSERYREGALMRTLGANSRLVLGSQFVEFTVIGLLSGLIAVVGAEFVVWAIQSKLFNSDFVVHTSIWLWLPVASGIVIGCAGYYLVRKVTRSSPLAILRQDIG
ncbi:ABC transporter permease [Alkalimarinus coralli]|uniref:ABC transporter permease n=1 Tax=Alkalimarinus coralli TaxID=2935863 RepID=UPI00202AEDB0|nr:FtsX-like permease family protein [Alkalimarinus coralli]